MLSPSDFFRFHQDLLVDRTQSPEDFSPPPLDFFPLPVGGLCVLPFFFLSSQGPFFGFPLLFLTFYCFSFSDSFDQTLTEIDRLPPWVRNDALLSLPAPHEFPVYYGPWPRTIIVFFFATFPTVFAVALFSREGYPVFFPGDPHIAWLDFHEIAFCSRIQLPM